MDKKHELTMHSMRQVYGGSDPVLRSSPIAGTTQDLINDSNRLAKLEQVVIRDKVVELESTLPSGPFDIPRPY